MPALAEPVPVLDVRICPTEDLPPHLRRLAAAVVLQAVKDATASRSDPDVSDLDRAGAVVFIQGPELGRWVSICGMEAETIRQGVEGGRPGIRFPKTLAVQKAASIFGVSHDLFRRVFDVAAEEGILKAAPVSPSRAGKRRRMFTDDAVDIVDALAARNRRCPSSPPVRRGRPRRGGPWTPPDGWLG